jgi:hypothetical protein
MDEQLTNFLKGVVGCVEANSFEQQKLWEDYHYNAEKLRYRKLSWEGDNAGICEIIGYVQVEGKDLPVNVSLFVKTIEGHRILFYDVVSRCADSEMVYKWFKEVLPKTAFRRDGYVNRVDAMNFHNVFPRDVPQVRAIDEKLDFAPGERFRYFDPDETNLHGPCYVVMPGGASLELNHHGTTGDDSVDVKRAKWIIDACNEKLDRDRAKG